MCPIHGFTGRRSRRRRVINGMPLQAVRCRHARARYPAVSPALHPAFKEGGVNGRYAKLSALPPSARAYTPSPRPLSSRHRVADMCRPKHPSHHPGSNLRGRGSTSYIWSACASVRVATYGRLVPGTVIPASSIPNRQHSHRRFRVSNFAQIPPNERAFALVAAWKRAHIPVMRAKETSFHTRREEVMRKSLFAASVSIAALGLSSPQPLVAQSGVDQQLGNVHFETSCNEVAQRRIDRAMRYQHSFWYSGGKEIFEEAANADPTCGIAYWGVALSLLNNPHSAIPIPNLPLGLAAIQKAKAVGAKTERERDYIDALMLMYADYDKLSHVQRIRSFLKAMETLAAKYPSDDEAQIAYAITLNTSASPADKTYSQQTKGAAILEPISKRLPQHPGVTHYLIHLYDYPETAEKGLEAANRYAKVAPAAPHAQHMPSHIYTRVGYWKESIASNTASVRAAKTEKDGDSQLHGWDYMVYAHLQLGQDKAARAVIEEMSQFTGFNPNVFAANYALAASPARLTFERGDWSAAAQLQVRPSRFNQAVAITHFARALGSARSGNRQSCRGTENYGRGGRS